ncbi:TetR/AcrR family transcriptional regulator [Alsobacter sp. SYSU M60028]|uniref:TetR/AcrR family transcriptional regulator n=1 Tax=Alsobacter ponti TaxID=2962936 RepID=A0ABT1LK15_9HYPH|nr:TetR/AcrR family transcriptional regulator [Alsobacter ponti]MCP8940593.1 TetR/AcrR family transcriptional regulator [Alsobacter ponti]
MTGKKAKAAIREGNVRLILEAAEAVFGELGFGAATTAAIAARAGLPKANVHYYFPSKEDLYRAVMARVLETWLSAASSMEHSDDPAEALTRYIEAKMDLSRSRPHGSRIFASEILRGAPVIADHLETTLKQWVASRSAIVERWIAEGKLAPVEPRTLFFMIWATTQHYADFARQIEVLNDGRPLSDAQFAQAKRDVVAMILRGVLPAREDALDNARTRPETKKAAAMARRL